MLPPPILGQTTTLNPGQATTSEISRLISFRADQVRTPNINISAAGINRYGVGPIQKQPFSAEFNDISVSLVSDGNAEIWQFWHNWVNNIFQHSGTSSSYPTYLAKYKDDFSTTIDIDIYTNDGNLSQTIELYQVFPTAISEVPLTWGDQNNPLRMSVTLSFSEYQILGSGLT